MQLPSSYENFDAICYTFRIKRSLLKKQTESFVLSNAQKQGFKDYDLEILWSFIEKFYSLTKVLMCYDHTSSSYIVKKVCCLDKPRK